MTNKNLEWKSALDARLSADDTRSVFADLAQVLMAIAGTDEASVLVREGDHLRFVATMTHAGPAYDLVGTSVPIANTVVGLVVVTGEVHVDAPRMEVPNAPGEAAPKYVVAAPIMDGDDVVGVLSTVSFRPDFELAQAALRHTERIARVIAMLLRLHASGSVHEGASAGERRLGEALAGAAGLGDVQLAHLAELVDVGVRMSAPR